MAFRRSSIRPAARLMLLVALVASAGVLPSRLSAASSSPSRFVRPDPDTIREEIKDILSDPRFSSRPSPLSAFWRWIREQLGRIRLPSLGVSGPVALIIIIWGVATLLAILIWNVWLVAYKGKRVKIGLSADDFELLKDKSFDELRAIIKKEAAAGRFRKAIGVMMLALLRWLDDAELVAFHRSKTNGDYVREYPADNAGRPDFRRFVGAFDTAIYGRSNCDRATYEDLNHLFERNLSHGQEKP